MRVGDLQALVGIDGASDSMESRLVYARDASNISGECLAVTWPANLKQLSALAAWACQEGIDLVPRGAGTGLCGGATPQSSIVVDLSRMTATSDLHVDARRIRAGAGVVIGALNRMLLQKCLFLPVVPGSHRAATIGGMLATNAAGLHAVRYGRMRDWVEQITLVDGRGKVRTLAGSALDDAVGREGVTGFIVEAVLRLAALPARRTLASHPFPSPTALLRARAELLQDERLTAMEYISRQASAVLGWEPHSHLMVEYDGEGGDIRDLSQIAEAWRARDSLYPLLARAGCPVIEDPQLDGEGLAALLDWLEVHDIPAFGHLGMGIIHPCFAAGDVRIGDLYRLVAEMSGQVSGEHGIGLKKKEWVDASYRSEIRRLKTVYDPQNVLNRGKAC